MGTDMPIVKVFHGSRFWFVSFRNLLPQVTVKIEYYADCLVLYLFNYGMESYQFRSIVCSADLHIILLFIYLFIYKLFIYQLALHSLKTKVFWLKPIPWYWWSNSPDLPHSSSWGDSFFPPNFYVIIIVISFKTVNNQPVEKVKISNNGALATGSRNLCDDMWGSDESTCGFDKDADGNAIWDSQVKRRVPHSLHNMSRVVHYLL